MSEVDTIAVFSSLDGIEEVIGNVYTGPEILTRVNCRHCQEHSFLRITVVSSITFTVGRVLDPSTVPTPKQPLSKRAFIDWCNDSTQARFFAFFFICPFCEAPHCVQLLPFTRAGLRMIVHLSTEPWFPGSPTWSAVTWRVPDEICWLLGKWSTAHAPSIDLRDEIEICPLLFSTMTGRESCLPWKYRAYQWALQRYSGGMGLYSAETKWKWSKWVNTTFDSIDRRARTFWDQYMVRTLPFPSYEQEGHGPASQAATSAPNSAPAHLEPPIATKWDRLPMMATQFGGDVRPPGRSHLSHQDRREYRSLLPRTSQYEHPSPSSSLGKRSRQEIDYRDYNTYKRPMMNDYHRAPPQRDCQQAKATSVWRREPVGVSPQRTVFDLFHLGTGKPEVMPTQPCYERRHRMSTVIEADCASDSGSNEGMSIGSSEALSDDESDSSESLNDFVAPSDDEREL